MPVQKRRKSQNKNVKRKPCSSEYRKKRVNAICSEMRLSEPEPKIPDPMDDPIYRYRQPKLVDFDKILDPDPHFPEGNMVILMKLLKKKPIPGLVYTDYDWYGL